MEDDLLSRVGVDYVETAREIVRDIVTGWAKTLTGLRHCDIRLEVQQGKGASVENGSVKQAGDDYSFAIGAHVLAGNGAFAPGYAGTMLGTADTKRLGPVIKEMLSTAHARAVHSADLKERARQRFPTLGSSLADFFQRHRGAEPVAIGFHDQQGDSFCALCRICFCRDHD